MAQHAQGYMMPGEVKACLGSGGDVGQTDLQVTKFKSISVDNPFVFVDWAVSSTKCNNC